MATGYIELLPGAATLPDGSSGNLALGLARLQGTETNPKKHLLALVCPATAETAAKYAWWTFKMPGDYASGGTLKILWIANAVANDVKYQARVSAVTPGDADTPLEHASAAAATVTTTVNATEANRLNTSSITLTMDSAAADDLVTIVLFVDPTDAAHTITVDQYVLAIELQYTTS